MPNDNEEIKLKRGETTTVVLKGLGTAGYQWSYTIDSNKNLVTIAKDFVLTEKVTRENAGQSANEVFIIKANRKGIAAITFSQQRSWEKNIDPVNEKKIKIIIG